MEDGALFRPTGNIGRRTITADLQAGAIPFAILLEDVGQFTLMTKPDG